MQLGNIRDMNILTVVIPTAGRDTLERCLESLQPRNQGGWGIDRLVVIDKNSTKDINNVVKLCNKHYVDWITFEHPYSDWGYPGMEYVYKHRQENGLYIMNIGDDDVFVEDTIPQLVNIFASSGALLQPYMVQAELHPSPHRGNQVPVVLWNDSCRSLERGKVTGQNLIVPNIPHLMGNMADDFEFIRQTIKKWDYNVTWVPKVFTRCY